MGEGSVGRIDVRETAVAVNSQTVIVARVAGFLCDEFFLWIGVTTKYLATPAVNILQMQYEARKFAPICMNTDNTARSIPHSVTFSK